MNEQNTDTPTTQDYVRAAIAGDALKAQEIFNQLMAPKVVDAIDQAREQVAQNYFGQHEVVVDEPGQPEIEDSAAVQVANSDDGSAEQDNALEQEEESNENA
jgi:hypothetical protein